MLYSLWLALGHANEALPLPHRLAMSITIFFLFFFSSFTSICNPLAYDRLKVSLCTCSSLISSPLSARLCFFSQLCLLYVICLWAREFYWPELRPPYALSSLVAPRPSAPYLALLPPHSHWALVPHTVRDSASRTESQPIIPRHFCRRRKRSRC